MPLINSSPLSYFTSFSDFCSYSFITIMSGIFQKLHFQLVDTIAKRSCYYSILSCSEKFIETPYRKVPDPYLVFSKLPLQKCRNDVDYLFRIPNNQKM